MRYLLNLDESCRLHACDTEHLADVIVSRQANFWTAGIFHIFLELEWNALELADAEQEAVGGSGQLYQCQLVMFASLE